MLKKNRIIMLVSNLSALKFLKTFYIIFGIIITNGGAYASDRMDIPIDRVVS